MTQALEEKIEKVCGKIDTLFKVHENHSVFLFGDGDKKGADERIRNVEDFVTNMAEFHKKIKYTIMGSAGAIVTAIIIAALVK